MDFFGFFTLFPVLALDITSKKEYNSMVKNF